ncbi:T9SS type A sorting domain-containing protein [uncultured Psychroserpens sp.]|uniref:T9SS type A sorting domain-containing protein n=1 Tax=uncultured Psychroserpens sp. TaxID=255436 RepID=UPI00260E4BCE|nr:T9SS type A sorting domain-containing protein [uncultured Psychroserpens sp.]
MKIFYFLALILFSLNSYSQTTFGYETATDHGDYLTETIDGITLTTSYTNVNILYAGGFAGSTENIAIAGQGYLQTLATFTFSEAVDITSIVALEGRIYFIIDYIFTPTGGNNPTITASVTNGGAPVTLNWTGVTSFTVTSVDANYAFDNLIISPSTLSTDEFTLKTVKIFPNPTTDFIEVRGLTTTENYNIYDVLGKEVKRGTISINEKIDARTLENGVYFLKFENANALKFIKK